MVELVDGDGGNSTHYGGDTLNTAVHLARLGHDVAYFTALGMEPASLAMRAGWKREGLDCSLVLTHPTREVGLYAITTGQQGERCFSYWRDTSAAREMFALPGSAEAIGKAMKADLLYFSLVSLAILPHDGRNMLLNAVRGARAAGKTIAFDGNFRPVLWSNAEEAKSWRDAAIALADIGLPTWDDEMAMSGPAGPEEIARHWSELGCAETLVKMGAQGCLLPDGIVRAPPERLTPLDTSGAGDAFNAGYIAARMSEANQHSAAEAGQRLAAWTIMRRGAIPARDALYPALGSRNDFTS